MGQAGDGVGPDLLEVIRTEDPSAGLSDVLALIAPGAVVTAVEPLRGGLGAASDRVHVRTRSGAETSFVLRRYVPDWDSPDDVRREVFTLEALRDADLPAPEMLWADPDGAVFGRPSIAQTFLPGRTSLTATTPAWARSLAGPLVVLHALPPSRFRHLAMAPRPLDLLRDELGDGPPERRDLPAREVHTVLVEHLPDPLRPVVAHGDYHPGNVLRDGEEVVGVVDWSNARITDPRLDLATTRLDLALVGAADRMRDLSAAYEEGSGRSLVDLAWFDLLVGLGALGDPDHWAASYALHGRPDLTVEVLRRRHRQFIATALSALTT